MAKAKRKQALPRVTLLAYSRRDLLLFCESVEQLRHLVADLVLVAESLKGATAKRRKMKVGDGENGENGTGS